MTTVANYFQKIYILVKILDNSIISAYDMRVTVSAQRARGYIMKIGNIGNNYGIYNLYSSMMQNSLALKNNKLFKELFPTNKAADKNALGEDALSYVKNIKASSKSLGDSLKTLSGPAFKAQEDGSTGKAVAAVEDFVKNYNDLYSEAVQKQDDPKAQKLATKLLNISKTYNGSLAGIGIDFDKDGKMKIDKQRLETAADNGKLQTFFTQNNGKNYGFTNQLANVADNVSRNTSSFVSSSVLGNSLMDAFTYSGTGKTNQYNFLNSGMLFDFLF